MSATAFPAAEIPSDTPSPGAHAAVRELLDLLGPVAVMAGADVPARNRNDYSGLLPTEPLAVVRPASTAEVAATLRICHAHGVAVVPQGGLTGLCGGGRAQGGEIALSLERMTGIEEIDPAAATMTLAAGTPLETVQQAADAAGFFCPLDLGARGSCAIGGNLSTNAGGNRVIRYGMAREMVLGLEVVMADGTVVNSLNKMIKNNAGFDLKHLFIGSEGTLGIITAATMKLYPRPAAQLTAWAAVPNLEAAVALLGLAHGHLGAGLTGFEVMGRFALGLVARHMPQLRVPFIDQADIPYGVLLENSDSESEAHARAQFERLLETAFEQGLVSDAVVAENLQQAHGLWHIRESIPLAQAEEGLNIKHDISLPVSRIPAFCADTDALLAREIPGVRLVNFGHLGDGNLHYNVQAPAEGDPKAFLAEHETRVNHLVFDQVLQFGGSISAEHGIGSLKAATLPHYKDPVALALMRTLKQALDPHNLLNPGRVLSAPAP